MLGSWFSTPVSSHFAFLQPQWPLYCIPLGVDLWCEGRFLHLTSWTLHQSFASGYVEFQVWWTKFLGPFWSSQVFNWNLPIERCNLRLRVGNSEGIGFSKRDKHLHPWALLSLPGWLTQMRTGATPHKKFKCLVVGFVGLFHRFVSRFVVFIITAWLVIPESFCLG